MLFLYQFNVLIIPSSKVCLGSQFNNSFALEQSKNKEVGSVGLDKS
jgi:hypothetical protein